MKKIVLFLIFAAFMVNVSSLQAADTKKEKKSVNKESVKVEKQLKKLTDSEVQELLARIEEINKMDVKSLTSTEKRELRREVRDIKDKLGPQVDGIYIGGGALLVIIIILLLLLV